MRWTLSEDEILRDLWPVMPTKEIAALVGRSDCAVIGRAHRLNLPRTPRSEINARIRAGVLRSLENAA